jgi:hypothetical protein
MEITQSQRIAGARALAGQLPNLGETDLLVLVDTVFDAVMAEEGLNKMQLQDMVQTLLDIAFGAKRRAEEAGFPPEIAIVLAHNTYSAMLARATGVES